MLTRDHLFQAFLVAVWNFELYMLPLTLIVLFLWNLIVREIRGTAAEDMVQFVSAKCIIRDPRDLPGIVG